MPSEESGGVIQMMDAMIADLDKEMQTEEIDEKNAQEEYAELGGLFVGFAWWFLTGD